MGIPFEFVQLPGVHIYTCAVLQYKHHQCRERELIRGENARAYGRCGDCTMAARF